MLSCASLAASLPRGAGWRPTLPTYDYILVGAGSAGAVVAARLTEELKTKVLLIEARPEDASLWVKIPLGFANILLDQEASHFLGKGPNAPLRPPPKGFTTPCSLPISRTFTTAFRNRMRRRATHSTH